MSCCPVEIKQKMKWKSCCPSSGKSQAVVPMSLQRYVSTTRAKIKLLNSMVGQCSEPTECRSHLEDGRYTVCFTSVKPGHSQSWWTVFFRCLIFI